MAENGASDHPASPPDDTGDRTDHRTDDSDEGNDPRADGPGAPTERPNDSDAVTDRTDDADAVVDRTHDQGTGRRDVIVPLPIYKRVTVVSTVVASVLVVAGFLLLDAATKQTRLLRGPIEAALEWLGLGVAAGTLSVALGIAGLGVIAVGAAIYVFGARFRTAGMGSDKTDAGETDGNG